MAEAIPPPVADVLEEPSFPLPPILTHPAAEPPILIAQGAEGRLYKTTYLKPTLPSALKFRPSKAWRHPTLDARLTRHRILSEARILGRCRREGIPVPAIYAVDEAAGWLMMEWVLGKVMRVAINDWLAARKEERRQKRQRTDQDSQGAQDELAPLANKEDEAAGELVSVLRKIGSAVGKLHKLGIIHGDLTTSNMMLRPWEKGSGPSNGHAEGEGLLDGEVVIIDFGLASQGTLDEDRAVDLYVLERAYASTHPEAEDLFEVVLEAYRDSYKQAPIALKKLDEVRMRGRKRSMIG